MTHRGLGGTSLFEPAEESRDREITLGPAMLAALVVALLALCSVCFIGGYSVGRNSQPVTAAPSPSGPSAAQLLREQPKPGPTQTSSDAQVAAQPTPTTPETAAVGTSTPAAASAGTASSTVAPPPSVVHAALPSEAPAGPLVSTTAPVQSALPPAGTWMVQIAAVAHEEDADVLMTALRQRGYAVRQRRDPADNLIHVQVGPFTSENDAIAMRQRLLNDGYNAVIQP
jgi:DedD protein